jgi:hypothetical protein
MKKVVNGRRYVNVLSLWFVFDHPGLYLPDKVEQESKFHVRIHPFSSEREVDTDDSDCQ